MSVEGHISRRGFIGLGPTEGGSAAEKAMDIAGKKATLPAQAQDIVHKAVEPFREASTAIKGGSKPLVNGVNEFYDNASEPLREIDEVRRQINDAIKDVLGESHDTSSEQKTQVKDNTSIEESSSEKPKESTNASGENPHRVTRRDAFRQVIQSIDDVKANVVSSVLDKAVRATAPFVAGDIVVENEMAKNQGKLRRRGFLKTAAVTMGTGLVASCAPSAKASSDTGPTSVGIPLNRPIEDTPVPDVKKSNTPTATGTPEPQPTDPPATNTPAPTVTAEATATLAPTLVSPENIVTSLKGEKDFLQGFTPQEETRIWEALEDLSTHAPQSYTIDNLKADKEFWDFFTKKYNVKEDDIARLLDIGPHFNAFRIRERQFPDTGKKFIYITKGNITRFHPIGYMEMADYSLNLPYVRTQKAKKIATGAAAYKEFVAIEHGQQWNRVMRGKGLASLSSEIIEVLTLQMAADYLASRLADLPESEQKGIKQRIEDFHKAIKNPPVGQN